MNAQRWARWRDIALYTLFGVAAYYVLAPLGELPSVRWLGPQAYKPWMFKPAFIQGLSLFALVALWFVASEPLGLRRPDLRLALVYPPNGVAAVLVLVVVAGLDAAPAIRPSARAAGTEDLATVLAAAVLGIGLARLASGRRVRRRRGWLPTTPAPLSFEELRRWATREAPVGETADLLDRGPIVRRLERHLTKPWGEEEGIAVLGEFGAGKSSLLDLLGGQLSRSSKPQIWIARVNCWGLETSAAAPLHILGRMISEIDRHVDCGRLRGMPQSYKHLISAEPTGLGTRLLEAVGQELDPQDLLQELSSILKAAGARVVLFLEDADRQGVDFEPAHIQRLLWMLRDVKGVSFVLALDPAKVRFDFSRVCDHIEALQRLNVGDVRRVLRGLREGCLTKFAFTDTVDKRLQEDKLDLRESASELEEYARRRYRNGVVDHLTELLSTPRALKHVVRRTLRTWETLHGEIDLDDLLVLGVLREGAPQVFEFLVQNIDSIRHKEDDRFMPPGADPVMKRWQELLEKIPCSRSAQELVNYLALKALAQGPNTLRPQGIQNDEPSDYFRRALSEDVGAGEIRDQEVLGEIDAWRHQRSTRLVERLVNATAEDKDYVEVFEHLSDGPLSPEDFRRLTNEVLTSIATRDGVRASGRHPALLAMWRRCNRHLQKTPETALWIRDLVIGFLGVSLGLTTELYYFWSSTRYGRLDALAREELRAAILKAAKARLSDPLVLALALDSERPWSLRHLVEPVDQEEPKSVLTDAADWAWLAPAIVGLVSTGRPDLCCQVVQLIGDFRRQERFDEGGDPVVEESYQLNRDRTRAIFSSHLADALLRLAKLPDEPWYLAAARGQVADWIADEGYDAR